MRELLYVGIRKQGIAAWLAADGQSVLDTYQRRQNDIFLVLLDVDLPILDGPQTLTSLQKHNPGICCCFIRDPICGYSEEDLLALGVELPTKSGHGVKV
jgi:DNA-binding response OmpR family regulator